MYIRLGELLYKINSTLSVVKFSIFYFHPVLYLELVLHFRSDIADVIRKSYKHLKIYNFIKQRSRRGLVGTVLAYYTKSQAWSPRPDIKNEIRKLFLRQFPVSRFLAKTLRAKLNCHERFLKKNLLFGVDFRVYLCIQISTHNISGVRS